nr:type II toxin-antitoxin system RelE/ParE family toxin [Aquabacterium terrae]
MSEEAERELARAFAYYLEHGSANVAERFLAEFVRAAQLIDSSPALGTPTLNGRRVFPMRRFPYFLVYRSTAEGTRIGAIAHQRRRPSYWKGRQR